jgi:hypothetical protein
VHPHLTRLRLSTGPEWRGRRVLVHYSISGHHGRRRDGDPVVACLACPTLTQARGARGTRIERILRAHGLAGAHLRLGWKQGSTRENPAHTAAPDLVDRDFRVSAPNRLWVADLVRHEALFDRVVMEALHAVGATTPLPCQLRRGPGAGEAVDPVDKSVYVGVRPRKHQSWNSPVLGRRRRSTCQAGRSFHRSGRCAVVRGRRSAAPIDPGARSPRPFSSDSVAGSYRAQRPTPIILGGPGLESYHQCLGVVFGDDTHLDPVRGPLPV